MNRQVVGFPLHMSAGPLGSAPEPCIGCMAPPARPMAGTGAVVWGTGLLVGAASGLASSYFAKPKHAKAVGVAVGVLAGLIYIYRPLGLPWGLPNWRAATGAGVQG